MFKKKQNVDPVLYMVEWFMCAFCRTLPWPTVLRVWDMFFCEGCDCRCLSITALNVFRLCIRISGVKVLFKVALVLFRCGLSSREQLVKCPTMYETVECLRNLPDQIMREDFLAKKVHPAQNHPCSNFPWKKMFETSDGRTATGRRRAGANPLQAAEAEEAEASLTLHSTCAIHYPFNAKLSIIN